MTGQHTWVWYNDTAMNADKTSKRCLILVSPPQPGLLEGFSGGLIALANYASWRLGAVDVRILDLGTVPNSAVANHVSKKMVSENGVKSFLVTFIEPQFVPVSKVKMRPQSPTGTAGDQERAEARNSYDFTSYGRTSSKLRPCAATLWHPEETPGTRDYPPAEGSPCSLQPSRGW